MSGVVARTIPYIVQVDVIYGKGSRSAGTIPYIVQVAVLYGRCKVGVEEVRLCRDGRLGTHLRERGGGVRGIRA